MWCVSVWHVSGASAIGLPLAKPKADARRIPRMQRVFVELRTTLPVDETTWFDRLGVAPQNKRAALRRQLQRKAGGETAEMRRVGGAGPEREADQVWFADLHRLDERRNWRRSPPRWAQRLPRYAPPATR